MASLISQDYSNYIFSNELCEHPSPMKSAYVSEGSASGMHGEVTLPFSSHISSGAVNMVPFDSDISSSSSMSMAAFLFPERLGASNMSTASATLPHYDGGLFDIAANEGFATRNRHQHEAYDFAEECNFWPVYPTSGGNIWEIQDEFVQRVEEPTLKIARYTAEEKKDRILRYLKKRSQRNFNKTIKYACRKTLADKRVRVRGRFAKNNELCDHDQTLVVKADNNNLQESEQSCYNNLVQMNPHDEEWLQEAIASLMYYRILPDNLVELPDNYLN